MSLTIFSTAFCNINIFSLPFYLHPKHPFLWYIHFKFFFCSGRKSTFYLWMENVSVKLIFWSQTTDAPRWPFFLAILPSLKKGQNEWVSECRESQICWLLGGIHFFVFLQLQFICLINFVNISTEGDPANSSQRDKHLIILFPKELFLPSQQQQEEQCLQIVYARHRK